MDGHVRVRVVGEVDLATVPQVASCLTAHAPGRGGSVVVDLSEVEFIDSTGIHLLMRVADEARRDGWTLTVEPSEAVRRIVSVLGLEGRLLAPPLSAVEAPSPRAAAAA